MRYGFTQDTHTVKIVNKINSQVAEWVNAKTIQVAQSIIVKVAPTGSIPVLTTKKKL